MFDYKQLPYTEKGRKEHEKIFKKIDCIGSDKCQINFASLPEDIRPKEWYPGMKELIKCQCGILYLKDSPRYDKETNTCDWCKREKKEKP